MSDPKHPRKFDEAFKRQIVKFYDAGKLASEIMAEYDLGNSTLLIITRREHRPFHGLRIGAYAVCVSRVSRSRNATSSRRAACAR